MNENDTRDKLPVDDVYGQGIDISFDEDLYRATASSWSPSTDIDWDRTVTVSSEKRHVLATIVSTFHYSSTSLLTLCGRLLDDAEDIKLKRIALILANANSRTIDVCSKYLELLEDTENISPFTREYFNTLFDEEEPVNILLGIGVLCAVMEEVTEDPVIDEPVFQSVASNLHTQSMDNTDIIGSYLHKRSKDMDPENFQTYQEQARQYRFLIQEIFAYHEEDLSDSSLSVMEQVSTAVDRFLIRSGATSPENVLFNTDFQ